MTDHKEEGNAFFRKGDNLKAAASYTKAIKASPSDHTLYSNRSAALLKLMKVGKAIDDAKRCIELAPDWPKGYFRLARAYEEKKSKDEMIAALEAGLKVDPENVDMRKRLDAALGRKPAKKAKKAKKAPAPAAEGAKAEDSAAPPPPKPAEATATATAPPAGRQAYAGPRMAACRVAEVVAARGGLDESYAGQIAECVETVVKEIHKNFLEKPHDVLLRPTAFLVPGDPAAPQPCIAIEKAFMSPDNHMSCTNFLRESIAKDSCVLAILAVEKGAVQYPKVWVEKTKSQWGYGDGIEGVFLQVEGRGVRFVFFYPIYYTGPAACEMSLEPVSLDPDRFALMPTLFW